MRSAIFSASPSSWVVSSTQTPALAQAGHDGPDRDAPFGVDPGRGFVEEGDLGPADEGQGQREALLLAAREVAPGGGGHGGQAHQVEQAPPWPGGRGSRRAKRSRTRRGPSIG